MTHPPARIAAALLAFTTGCASMQADRARAQYLTTQLDALRYAKPLDEVWPEVRRLLAEKGYPLAGGDAKAVGQSDTVFARLFTPAKETRSLTDDVGLFPSLFGPKGATPGSGRFLETGWRGDRDRYRVEGLEDGQGCRVGFTVIAQDLTEHGRDAARHRDLEMELELARRVDPEAAARIEAGFAR